MAILDHMIFPPLCSSGQTAAPIHESGTKTSAHLQWRLGEPARASVLPPRETAFCPSSSAGPSVSPSLREVIKIELKGCMLTEDGDTSLLTIPPVETLVHRHCNLDVNRRESRVRYILPPAPIQQPISMLKWASSEAPHDRQGVGTYFATCISSSFSIHPRSTLE